MKRGANKTNVTRQGLEPCRCMNNERIRSDSTMQHLARQETKLELMVLHEYTTPKCFPNTSLTIRLSRPLIRTDTSFDRDSRGTPRVRDHSTRPELCPRFKTRGTPRVRPDPVVTGTEHFSYNTCPKADQNCAGLMRAERHVTRRDVVSCQTEGNSVSVVEAVLRVEGYSHKICKFITGVKTP